MGLEQDQPNALRSTSIRKRMEISKSNPHFINAFIFSLNDFKRSLPLVHHQSRRIKLQEGCLTKIWSKKQGTPEPSKSKTSKRQSRLTKCPKCQSQSNCLPTYTLKHRELNLLCTRIKVNPVPLSNLWTIRSTTSNVVTTICGAQLRKRTNRRDFTSSLF